MTAKNVVRNTIQACQDVTKGYLSDLSDAELLVRPVPGANHIAWQLGHLIGSEREMIGALGHAMPELPAGFAEAHSKEAAARDAGFASRAEYVALSGRVRAATLAALEGTSESDLDAPAPEAMRSYAATVAAVFNIVGIHEMMHAGQFAVVRRKLGKPVLF
jgi:hypothetical protein